MATPLISSHYGRARDPKKLNTSERVKKKKKNLCDYYHRLQNHDLGVTECSENFCDILDKEEGYCIIDHQKMDLSSLKLWYSYFPMNEHLSYSHYFHLLLKFFNVYIYIV